MPVPLIYLGDGAFQASSPYHSRRCNQLFGLGELITVDVQNERSMKSHAHYFAMLTELWQTLPEKLSRDFPSPEHLRKWALIETGYCIQSRLVLQSHEDAIEAESLLAELDTYIITEVIDRVLTVWRAMSQSLKAMNKETFEKSKTDTLGAIRKLIGPNAYGAL